MFDKLTPKMTRSEIARLGGIAAHAQGNAHEFTPLEASAAAKIAHAKGTARKFTSEQARAAGRKGGKARAAMRAALTLERFRVPKQQLYFEYHCLESHTSGDAQLWYRSHQKITVIRMVDNDGVGIPSLKERLECGQQLIYRVQFTDGYQGDVFEDELLDSQKEYCRPSPPLPLTPPPPQL